MHGQTDEHILERLLEDNEELARHNREHFDELGVLAVNFMSAPGAGKTSLIAATAAALRDEQRFCVIEGDMVGELDTDRLRKAGVAAFQINTGRSCHLDAQMVAQFLHSAKLPATDLLLIENVGNLVCPAEFPLGEHLRVVLLSVTEGDDKPFKYPVIFHRCHAVIFTKCDLLAHVDFNQSRARSWISSLNPDARVFEISTQTGAGIPGWSGWLTSKLRELRTNNRSDADRLGQDTVNIAAHSAE